MDVPKTLNLEFDGSGAARDIADKEVFLKNLSLCESDVPVDLPIEAKAASAPFEIELPFADSVSQFESRERRGSRREGLETLQWSTPRLDPAVVLLDDVVQVLTGAHAHIPPLHVLSPQLPQCGAARHVTIQRDGTRKAVSIRGERFAEERLRRCDSAVATQQKVNRLPVLVDGSIQVVPLSPNADVRLVGAPRPADASPEPVPALLELRYETQRPSKDGRVRQIHTAFGHHLDQIPVGEAVTDVPAHTEDDDLGIKPSLPVDPVPLNRLRHSAALRQTV